MKRLAFAAAVLLSCLVLQPDSASAQSRGEARGIQGSSSLMVAPVRAYLDINNISTVIKNTGILDIDTLEANAGLVYPKGSGKTAVYQSGFLWGGWTGGEIRVGGSAYREGLAPGKIISPGVAEDPDLPKNRIYRVRPDERPGSEYDADLTMEEENEGLPSGDIRARYETDWLEWPAADGAPFDDLDTNGSYDPLIDMPGVGGAGQTIWYVANDLDSVKTTFLYGSKPIGLEVQVTVWAYVSAGALDNTFFRRYLLINRAVDPIDSMYVSPWSDPDVGRSTDDYAGCDSALDLGYCYNGLPVDTMYGDTPPAVGFALLRGPLVPSPGDTGAFNGYRVSDHKNLRMSAFYYFARGDVLVTDPTEGDYEGTLQFYNFFQALIGRTGQPFMDPTTHETTMFPLSGDPLTSQGFMDGLLLPPGDRRIGLSAGPFTMAPGDTQEVVVAEILAGGTPGVDRFSAVSLLKYYAAVVKDFFDSTSVVTALEEEPSRAPAGFMLSQNYPNPFNPVTTITYSVPSRENVRLSIFNVLGEEIRVLVDGPEPAGQRSVSFDAAGLPSGVYTCRLTAGIHSDVRKLVLLK